MVDRETDGDSAAGRLFEQVLVDEALVSFVHTFDHSFGIFVEGVLIDAVQLIITARVFEVGRFLYYELAHLVDEEGLPTG